MPAYPQCPSQAFQSCPSFSGGAHTPFVCQHSMAAKCTDAPPFAAWLPSSALGCTPHAVTSLHATCNHTHPSFCKPPCLGTDTQQQPILAGVVCHLYYTAMIFVLHCITFPNLQVNCNTTILYYIFTKISHFEYKISHKM
jgi:hypothetical protein